MRISPSLIALALLGATELALAADTWSTPHPGMRHLYRTTATPWRIRALEVDLCAAGVSLRATASGERQRTTSSFGSLVQARAAINGDFFSFSSYATSGLAVGDGAKWADTSDSGSSGFVAFGVERLLLSPPSAVVNPPPAWMREVVSGRPELVKSGVAMASDPSTFCTTRHPRTAIGLSRDERKLILAVVDGRTSLSVGMRCTELAALMKDLGAHHALNLDGGGSTTMWIAGSGVVNAPSDGSQRVVANHLAVRATGSGEPASCVRAWEEAAVLEDAWSASTSTDVDGDGRADVCARASAGIRCRLGGSLQVGVNGPELSNATGWADESNYATLRMGDIDGDGRADICARANAGVRCWLSDGAGFPTVIDGPALSDASGWDRPEYYGTLRLADIDGDGRADLCARAAAGLRCYPATGAGFGAAIPLNALSDANGFAEASRFGTIRFGDIDGDGRADVCARAAAGMRCWRSLGTGFGPAIDGPAWSDSSGFDALPHWSTIRMGDLNGDGRADLCVRAAAGVSCHLSTGSGFGAAIPGPAWSDASGWARHKNYSTLRLADLDGDGASELCARANAGIRCVRLEGTVFGSVFSGPALSDASGWNQIRYYSTIRFGDVTGDGRADLCARAAAGVRCWPAKADGSGFEDEIVGPEWSDASGWGKPEHYDTLRLASVTGPGAGGAAGAGGGAAGDGGLGGDGGGGAGHSGGGATTASDGGGAKRGSTTLVPRDDAGCGCRAGSPASLSWLAALGAAGLLGAGGLRRTRTSAGARRPRRSEVGPR